MTDNDIDKQAMRLFEQAFVAAPDDPKKWILSRSSIAQNIRDLALELLAFDDQECSAILTGNAHSGDDELTAPENIGAYKIVRKIGQGGMGAVYKGQRDKGDFDHDVAIKLIKPSALSNALIDRFQRERQILAGFAHPNIAQLYDGGTMPDSTPYFIMEYIDGQSIVGWVNQKRLNMTARLDLFISVCEAISYAHQNLIVHRDITPNNVLVTQDGIVKLIDFGVAKPNAEGELNFDETHSLASLSFTPGFAAPERFQGEYTNTLSDIYSLGKLLEVLLKDMDCPDDLQSIIIKATQKDPKMRYISADALISDITHFIKGRVVNAHNAGSFYLVKKFVARQKLAVSLSIMMAFALMGGLISTSVLYQRAETARAEVNTRFNEVRSIANFMLYDLYDDLKSKPGNTKSLETIATQASQYLARLNATRTDDFDLQMEVIEGYHRLADITGNPVLRNLGQASQAEDLYAQTYARLEVLLNRYPNNERVLREFARLFYAKASVVFVKDTNYEETFVYVDQGLTYLSKLKNATDMNVDDELLRIQLLTLKGTNLLELSKGEEAIVFFEDTQVDILKLVEVYRGNHKLMRGVAEFYHRYAFTLAWHVYNIDGEDALALPLYNKSIDIYLDLIDKDPKTALVNQTYLASVYTHRAETYVEMEQYDAALQDNLIANDYFGAALAVSPDDQRLRTQNGINMHGILILSAVNKNKEEVLRIIPPLIFYRRQDIKNNPGDIGYIRLLASTLLISGESLLDVGEEEQACVYILESLKHITHFSKINQVNESDKKNLLVPIREKSKKCQEG